MERAVIRILDVEYEVVACISAKWMPRLAYLLSRFEAHLAAKHEAVGTFARLAAQMVAYLDGVGCDPEIGEITYYQVGEGHTFELWEIVGGLGVSYLHRDDYPIYEGPLNLLSDCRPS